MSEEQQKNDATTNCRHTECVINWLKVVDDVSVAGVRNKFPRMFWVTGALLILFVLI